MASNASGVTDTRTALDRGLAMFGVAEQALAEDIILVLDGARVPLPADAKAIEVFVEKSYRVGGFEALRMIHEAAVTSATEYQNPTTASAGILVDEAHAWRDRARDATTAIPESGDTSDALKSAAEAGGVSNLYSGAMGAATARRAVQLGFLRQSIDRIAEIEETAQRWYEPRLMASIAADFARRQADLDTAWRKYQIGDAETKVPVAFKYAQGAEGLTFLPTEDTATIEAGEVTNRVQGETKTLTLPAVIVATYELARAQHAYREALAGAKKAANYRGGKVDPKNFPAWVQRRDYAMAQEKWAEDHFIALAAHRRLIGRTFDTVFDRKVYETAIIEAFFAARKAMPELLAKMQANILFTDDEPAAVTGRAAMARTAAEVLIEARYRQAEQPVLVKPTENPAGKDLPAPDVYYSPWVQQPFHDRLQLLADVFRIEEAEARIVSSFPKLVSLPADPPPQEAPPDPKVLARMKAEVAHLRHLFPEPRDRMMLGWSTSMGTLMGRARTEVAERLDERIVRQDQLRTYAQWVIAGASVVLIPFTGGSSLLVAGALDAALIGGKLTEDIAQWMAAKQFSKAVLDLLALMHWREPEVAMLVGMILAGGFEIAGDLVQSGAAAKVFDMIFGAMLLASIAETVETAGKETRR